MKKLIFNRRNLTGLLVILLVFTMSISVALTDAPTRLLPRKIEVRTGVNLTLNGLPFNFLKANGQSVEPFVYNNTTYIPVRSISEALGVDVAWKSDTNEVNLGRDSVADAIKYLSYYFDINELGQSMSWARFNDALIKIGSSTVEGVDPTATVSMPEATKAIVKAADMNELALTYPHDKVALALKSYGVSDIPTEYAQYVTCALDTALVPRTVDFSAELDGSTAAVLLMNAVQAAGKGRNYLGFSDDPRIYAQIQSAWSSFTLFEEEVLDAVGVGIVKEKATTGYLLTYSGNSARFIPEYTIQYDHSNITHANQLIGLLNSEGIVARVQLEPKTSVYEYMLEWGPIGEPTPKYAVIQVSEDLYLANSVGYVLSLEFQTLSDKLAFDDVIESYAKKYEGNEDAIGLIRGSYWQPLYSSKTEMPSPAYVKMYDISINNGGYTLNSFTLEEKVDIVRTTAIKLNPDLVIESETIWCNAAFYRYLTGSDFQ